MVRVLTSRTALLHCHPDLGPVMAEIFFLSEWTKFNIEFGQLRVDSCSFIYGGKKPPHLNKSIIHPILLFNPNVSLIKCVTCSALTYLLSIILFD